MKKNFLFLFVMIICCFMISGCGSRNKALTSKDFKSIASSNKFDVTDVSEQFKDDESVKESYLASNDNIQIEFYVLKDNKKAKEMFSINKQAFSEKLETTSSEETDEGKNYSMYSLITGEEYMYVMYIDNTLISLRCDVAYYGDAKSMLEKLKNN